MSVQDIALIAKRKQGYDEFLRALQEAMNHLPPRGTVPQQAGMENALEVNLVAAASIAHMIRRQLG